MARRYDLSQSVAVRVYEIRMCRAKNPIVCAWTPARRDQRQAALEAIEQEDRASHRENFGRAACRATALCGSWLDVMAELPDDGGSVRLLIAANELRDVTYQARWLPPRTECLPTFSVSA